MTAPLTDNDKKNMLAGALRIRSYNIDDITDTDVFYTQDNDPGMGTFRGTYQCPYTIADNKVTIGTPTQVVKRTIYQPLVVVGAFSLDGEAQFSGDTVIRSGKVFECGDYPDKGFSLTEAEADAAITGFKSVNNDLEHKRTILDGKLGSLSGLKRVGNELFGSVSIPKWLHEAVGNTPIKTSLAWDIAKKTIVGLGLVLNPRIADAQLVAAFNEASGLNSKEGIIVPKLTWFENLKALFSDKKLPEGLEDFDPQTVRFAEEAPQPPKPDAKPAEATTFSKAQFDAQAARVTELEAELASKAAVEFADAAITAGKAFPAERAALIAQFAQARKDDSAGIACFAADGTTPTTRVVGLQSMIEARPSHGLTAEMISGIDPKNPPKLTVLSPADFSGENPEVPTAAGKQPSDERVKRLAEFSHIKEVK
jgi:hypothetical protein